MNVTEISKEIVRELPNEMAEKFKVYSQAPRVVRFSRPGLLEASIDTNIAPTLQLTPTLQLASSAWQTSNSQPNIQPNTEGLAKTITQKRKLFLVPTPHHLDGEEADSEYPLRPSALADLPPLHETVNRYVLGIVEIWGGRRQPMQLARLSHRLVYSKILTLSGNQREIPKIRRVYIQEPIEGVAETTVTLRFNERVRSLVLRFEGVDNRWLCTELSLL